MRRVRSASLFLLFHLIQNLLCPSHILHHCYNRTTFSKDAYSTSTKKQKTKISKSIVESIKSMDPPGRFLKKCPDTREWIELSKEEAWDRAAQAMAYAVRVGNKTEKESTDHPRESQANVGVAASSVTTHATGRIDRGGEVDRNINSAANDDDDDDDNDDDVLPQGSSLRHQLLHQLQQQSISGVPQNDLIHRLQQQSISGVPQYDLTQRLVQTQAYLQQQQQRQLLNQYLMIQHPLEFPSILSSTYVPPDNIIGQAYLFQGNYGTGGIQPDRLLQSQPNYSQPYPHLDNNSLQLQTYPPSNLGATEALAVDPPPEEAQQQLDQEVQRGGPKMLQQNQWMPAVSILLTASTHLPLEQQLQLRVLLEQITVLLQQHTQDQSPSIETGRSISTATATKAEGKSNYACI